MFEIEPGPRYEVNLSTPRPIEFKYKVVLHEKDLSNLKVDPLRIPKKQKLKSPTVKLFFGYDPTGD